MVSRPKKPDRLPGRRCKSAFGHCRGPRRTGKGAWALDYTERLRRLAINDTRAVEDGPGEGLDQKTAALVRLAALVAVGGAVPSYGAEADATVSAAARPSRRSSRCWSVSSPSSVSPVSSQQTTMAMALGYDTEDDLDVESC